MDSSNKSQKDRSIKTTKKSSEISHYCPKGHKLRFKRSRFPFVCNGCKIVGVGLRYKCSTCDYNLHKHCATHPRLILHPFFPKCSFQFLSRPPGDKPRVCDACEDDVTGFVYHCRSCGFDLHPCCVKLPILLKDGEAKVYLYRKVDEPCYYCGRKVRSWGYRSISMRYSLHVACVRKILVDHWPEIYMGRNKRGEMEIGIPRLKNTLQTRHNGTSRKGKAIKWCKRFEKILPLVISAVLGEPSVLIAGIVGSMFSSA